MFAAMGRQFMCTNFVIPDILPGTFGMLFGTAHASSEVLQAVHVKPPTAITRRDDTLAALEFFHPSHHFHLIRTPVVSFKVIDGFWLGQERRRRVWNGHGASRVAEHAAGDIGCVRASKTRRLSGKR
jgi:hypothetical protein